MADETTLLKALQDPHWDARTIDGLRRSTGLSKEKILEIAGSHPELIEMYTSKRYGLLMQLRDKDQSTEDFLEKTLNYLSMGKRRRIA